MGELLIDFVLMALSLVAIAGIGRSVRRFLPLTFWGRAADLAYALAFGLGVVATLLFVLSLFGLLIPAVGWALLITGLLLAGVQYRAFLDDLRSLHRSAKKLSGASWFIKGMVALGAIFMLTNLIADFAPPVEGDSVHQYLLTVRYWVAAGRYVQPTHIWAATLPGNTQMLSAWALLLRDSYSLASLVTGFGMSLFFALGVYSLARLHFGQGVALLAVITIYTMPDAGYLAQSAKVDMGWAFLEALALAAFLRFTPPPNPLPMHREGVQTPPPSPLPASREGVLRARHALPQHNNTHFLILSGVCLGLAAGAKNQTFISMVLLGGWLIGHHLSRNEGRELLRSALIFGGAAIIALLPFYLYNVIVHRNPMYPVFADIFVSLFGATPSPRSELGTEVFYPWSVGGYLQNLWNASLGHPPGFYLGFIAGPLFLLTLPAGMVLGLLRRQYRSTGANTWVSPLHNRQRRILWQMLLYVFVFSIIWFLVKQAARHFLPGLILLSVVSGFILWQIDHLKNRLRPLILIAALFAIGLNLISEWGVLYWSGAYRVGLGLETREEYLERWHDEVITPTFPDWELVTYLNENLTAAERILATHATSSLYITPDIVSDNWGDRIRYTDMSDDHALLDALAEHRIHYLLIYHAPSPQQSRYAEVDFLAAHADLVFETPRARLYRIRED